MQATARAVDEWVPAFAGNADIYCLRVSVVKLTAPGTVPVPPHIYTIAPDRPFLATLAQGLLGLAGGDPLSLTRMTVLLPTRRAARSLREAFLRLTAEGSDPGAPLLLPRLRPIGD